MLKNAQSRVVGAKQTLKALEKGMARKVFIAKDADEKVVRPVIYLCDEHHIRPHYVNSMYELGKLCGIKVKAAVAAITD